MIDITTAPRVPFTERRKLPKASGVYVVLSDGQVVYVGISVNFWQRWTMGHHKADAIKQLPNVEICYFEMSIEDAQRLETLIIQQLNPTLNSPNAPSYSANRVSKQVTSHSTIKNIYWTERHESAIQILYEQMIAQGIPCGHGNKPNASAIILYALTQSTKGKRDGK